MTNRPRDLSHFANLDDFLNEHGIREEVTLRAVKSVIALQLQQAMADQKITRAAMAAQRNTSRAQLNRVLDPNASNVTLGPLSRAVRVLGRALKVGLVYRGEALKMRSVLVSASFSPLDSWPANQRL